MKHSTTFSDDGFSLSPSDGERAGVRGWGGREVRGLPESPFADATKQRRLEVPRYVLPLTLYPSPHPMGRGKFVGTSRFHSNLFVFEEIKQFTNYPKHITTPL